jgi:hypothetical protein
MSKESEAWLKIRALRWADVVPWSLALEQARWERRSLITRNIQNKCSDRIGDVLGLTVAAVWTIYTSYHYEKTSPIERYFSEKRDLVKLGAMAYIVELKQRKRAEQKLKRKKERDDARP